MKMVGSQKQKINLMTLTVLGVFIMGWLFVYFQSQQKVYALKEKLFNIQNQIHAIEMLESQENVSAGSVMEKGQDENDMKLPHTEEEGLLKLSDFARKTGLEVISIKSQPKADLLDQKRKKVMVGDNVCQIVAVSLIIRGSYEDLVKYLDVLIESSPVQVTIERLKIQQHSVDNAQLDISLELRFYLLS